MKTKLPPTVSFIYDEAYAKWAVLVTNVDSPLEAAQAFNSVVLTCKTIENQALAFTGVSVVKKGVYHVIPAEIAPDPEMN